MPFKHLNKPHTVIEHIVDPGLCIGCGICVALCPHDLLSMKFNAYGEYNAALNKSCNVDCNLCLTVCPFYAPNKNEDDLAKGHYETTAGIEHSKETGYYLKGYYGYSLENDQRKQGTSGGLTRWLLSFLLSQGKVDYVVCVTKNNDPEKLYKYEVFGSAEEFTRASGSAYYPVELSEVAEFILTHEGSFALVGLPCFIKAIRLAQLRNSRLKTRVKYLIGLVCGQTKSKHFTSFVSRMAGVTSKPSEVIYRGKKSAPLPTNYTFQFKTSDGQQREMRWFEGVDEIWSNQWFTPKACNYCDDVFAETADIVLMDPWLPEYVFDWRGANLLITRSMEINDILVEAGKAGRVYLKPIPIDRIIESQSPRIKAKRKHLAYRLFEDKKEGRFEVIKRTKPSDAMNIFEINQMHLKDKMQFKSRELFFEMQKRNHIDPAKMYRLLRQERLALLFWEGTNSLLKWPLRIYFQLKRRIKKVFA